MLELYGRPLSGDDQRVLRAFADQLAVAIERSRWRDAAEASARQHRRGCAPPCCSRLPRPANTAGLDQGDGLGAARADEVEWQPGSGARCAATVDEETDRLNRLVGNLLDASRLQIGALAVELRPSTWRSRSA